MTTALQLTNEGEGISYNPETMIVALAEGKTAVLTATYTVKATDNELLNAVVVGNEDDPEKPGDDVTTDVEDKEAWTVEKTVSGMKGADGKAQVGDTLTYTITIANTGNVKITKNVTDTFTVDGEEVKLTLTPAEESQGTYADGQVTLAEGETAVLTATYTVQATDNELLNAVVVGNEDDPEKPGDEVPTEVEDKEAWTVEKTVSGMKGADGKAQVGDTLTYTITIANTGNVKITKDVTDTFTVDGKEVTLSLEPAEESQGMYADGRVTLAEGETAVLTATYTVQATDNELLNAVVVGNEDDPEKPGDEVPTEVEDKEAWTVEKTVSGMKGADGKAQVGDTLTYTITIANTGNVKITKDVTDTFTVDGKEVTLSLEPAEESQGMYADGRVTLAEGETAVLTATYTVQATDNELLNAVVVGNEDDPEKPGDEVPTEVEDKEAWTVEKTVSGMKGADGKAQVGDTLTYTITIANTGNVKITKDVTDTFTVDGKEVTLSLEPAEESQGMYADGQVTLAEGETAVLTATYTVKATDNELLNAVVVGNEDDPDKPEDEVPTEVEDKEAWTVEKTVSGMKGADGKAQVGDTLTYTITIANTGNVKITKDVTDTFTVDGKEVTLSLEPAKESQGMYADGRVTLAEGETAVLTATYTVQATDSSLVNTVVVGNEDDEDKPEDEVLTDVEDKPAWTVDKQLTNAGTGENGAFKLGEVAKFDIVIENTGNTVLTDLTVAENLDGAVFIETEDYTVSEDGATATVESIAVGESVTLKAEYTIEETDLGREIKNVVTTKLDDPDTPGPNPEGEEEIPVDEYTPALAIDKIRVVTEEYPEGHEFAEGEIIIYQVTVTNTGNITLNDVTLTDVMTGVDGVTVLPSNLSEEDGDIGILLPKENAVITYTHEVTEADLGGILHNVATATAYPAVPDPASEAAAAGKASEPLTATDDEDVPTIARDPKLSVEKEVTSKPAAEDGKYVLGETITYKVTVTNTGNLTLNDIVVSDVLTRPDGTTTVPSGFSVNDARIDSLEPGASAEITYDHVIVEADLGGALTNAATATGQPDIPDPDPETPDPDPTPDEPDEVIVDTEDPSNCSITVTKQTTDYMGEPLALNAGAAFQVALFTDEAMTQRVGEVQTIVYEGNSSTASVTFEGLKRGTYYVAEVDEAGNVIADSGTFEGGVYVPQYADGNQVVITENGAAASFAFTNAFLVLPSDGEYYWEKTLTITKNVKDLNGKDMNVNDTFYAGIFTDESLTTLADNVSQNIVSLRLNGTSSVSVEVGVTVPVDGSEITLYVAEVNSAGVPVENVDGFAYNVEVENGAVTLAEESEDAVTVITNTSTEETIESECENTGDKGKSEDSGNTTGTSSRSVKTGDETPIMMLVCMLGLSAMAIILLASRRRRSQG